MTTYSLHRKQNPETVTHAKLSSYSLHPLLGSTAYAWCSRHSIQAHNAISFRTEEVLSEQRSPTAGPPMPTATKRYFWLCAGLGCRFHKDANHLQGATNIPQAPRETPISMQHRTGNKWCRATLKAYTAMCTIQRV